jgi:hypothetical protein
LHRYLAEFDFRYNNRVALGVDDGERLFAGCERQAAHLSNDCYLSMAGARRKPRKRKPKTEPDNEAQSARFVEAAKALGVDESGKAFKRALDTLLPKGRARKKTGT